MLDDQSIDARDGAVPQDVFSRDIHEREIERILGSSRLLLGHASATPDNDNYFTSCVGKHPVIAQRHAIPGQA